MMLWANLETLSGDPRRGRRTAGDHDTAGQLVSGTY